MQAAPYSTLDSKKAASVVAVLPEPLHDATALFVATHVAGHAHTTLKAH